MTLFWINFVSELWNGIREVLALLRLFKTVTISLHSVWWET